MGSGLLVGALGSGIVTAQSAVALFFVYRRLSRVRHALVWTIAFVALTLQWFLLAMAGPVLPRLPTMATAGAAGIIGLLLFVEGFHMRARGGWPSRARIAVGAAIVVLMTSSSVFRTADWSATLIPLVSGVLFCLAAREVVAHGRRASFAEIAVVALLMTQAILKLSLIALGPLGVGPATAFIVRATTWMPLAAASGLFTLLLIASDFSGELGRLLHTDPLTGVLNRAGFEERARAALGRARGRPIALAVADIDLFKGVNDRFGHAAGDAALACVADSLRAMLGREDVLGRIGGEEFAILFWNSDGLGAVERVELVRASLPEQCVSGHPDIRVTASFGLAERLPGSESLAGMIERADRALYTSKRGGRDRTTLAEAA